MEDLSSFSNLYTRMFVFMSVHARYALPVAIDSAEFVFDFEVRDMEDLYSNEFRYTI